MILDIKTPGSGEVDANLWTNPSIRLRPTDEVKFVVCNRADFDWAAAIVRTQGLLRCPDFVQCGVWASQCHGSGRMDPGNASAGPASAPAAQDSLESDRPGCLTAPPVLGDGSPSKLRTQADPVLECEQHGQIAQDSKRDL